MTFKQQYYSTRKFERGGGRGKERWRRLPSCLPFTHLSLLLLLFLLSLVLSESQHGDRGNVTEVRGKRRDDAEYLPLCPPSFLSLSFLLFFLLLPSSALSESQHGDWGKVREGGKEGWRRVPSYLPCSFLPPLLLFLLRSSALFESQHGD